MTNKPNKKINKIFQKSHKDKGLQYYKQTLDKKDIVKKIISLKDFVKQYKGKEPNISKIIYGGSFIPNIEHNCNGNCLYLATLILFGEFDYIEGVLRDLNKDLLYHHAWLYSKTLNCYMDPTLEPEKGVKYYISNRVSYKDIPSFISFDRLENTQDPQWINQGVKSKAKIIHK